MRFNSFAALGAAMGRDYAEEINLMWEALEASQKWEEDFAEWAEYLVQSRQVEEQANAARQAQKAMNQKTARGLLAMAFGGSVSAVTRILSQGVKLVTKALNSSEFKAQLQAAKLAKAEAIASAKATKAEKAKKDAEKALRRQLQQRKCGMLAVSAAQTALSIYNSIGRKANKVVVEMIRLAADRLSTMEAAYGRDRLISNLVQATVAKMGYAIV
jgi:hypothetical protein